MSELLRKGYTHFQAGRIKEASQCFEQALAADPHNVEALNNLGVIAYKQQELGRAAQYFSQALEEDPFYLDAVTNLCQVLRIGKRLAKALPLLQAVAARYPDNEDVKDLIAEIEAEPQSTHSAATVRAQTTPTKAGHATTQTVSEIELRKFPYPYRAAFTISNDIDLTSWKMFVDIYTYLCSNGETALGQGLGLPIASSFFLFNFSKRDQFAYFANADCAAGPQREQIEHLIKNGYLDNIHGFGSFTKQQPFQRELAERAYRILAERDLHVPIWSCHGDESSTAQVDSTGQVAEAFGDDKGSTAYHFDLTRKYGVRYIWQWHDGGITDVIGQGQSSLITFGNKKFLPTAKEGRKNYRGLDPIAAHDAELQNHLLRPITLRDGSRTYNFSRFSGGLRRCNAATLDRQLRPEYLTELIQNQAYMVLYTHLGGARTSADGPPVVNQPPYFGVGARAALLYVSELFREGHLWVAPTAQLLDFNYLVTHLTWHVERSADYYDVVLEKIKDEFLQIDRTPSEEDCRGLAFYTPDPQHTRLFLGDHEVKEIAFNSPDITGKASVSIPLRRMPSFEVD